MVIVLYFLDLCGSDQRLQDKRERKVVGEKVEVNQERVSAQIPDFKSTIVKDWNEVL